MDREEGQVVVMGRTEIETRAPFKSVKEAVMLFGERVLAGEIYANKLRETTEMRAKGSETGSAQSKIGALTAALEETKQSLEKAKEEANLMACCIKSLKEELEQTKKELREAKARRELMSLQKRDDPEIEELKFVETLESAPKVEIKLQIEEEEAKEFQKKRYVKFASPPAIARVNEVLLERPPSVKKAKRKPLMPLIGWLFARRKGTQEVDSPRA